MRSISISTDVFARIWSLREPGEDTEDDILRRVLKCSPFQEAGSRGTTALPSGDGFYDARHRVSFREGFEVFRNYLGTEYRARAAAGAWVLQSDGRAFGSLNELSRAVGPKTENAWANWYFLDDLGQRRPVSDLRDPNTIVFRKREKEEEMTTATGALDPRLKDHKFKSDGTWRDDVRVALKTLGGRASLHRIYQKVEALRTAAKRSVPPSLEATVRRTLEDHSSDSENYRGGPDLFYMPEGKGAGIWALR